MDSIVDLHKHGKSADEIVYNFPSLTLDEVHEIIAFYERNCDPIDAYMKECDAEYRRLWAESKGLDVDWEGNLVNGIIE